MQASIESQRRRTLSAVCAVALGLVFFTNPLTHLLYRSTSDTPLAIAMRGFGAPIEMVLLVGAVFGITELLRPRADRLGLAGATITIMGWAVGVRILALGQLESLLRSGLSGLPADVLTRLLDSAPIVWVSIVPVGLMFPIGLTLLGLTLAAVGPIPRPIGILLIAGAVLFPIGRIGLFPWALVTCDLILGASFVLIGWQLSVRMQTKQE